MAACSLGSSASEGGATKRNAVKDYLDQDSKRDVHVFHLATEVAESPDNKIPILLLKLKDILKGPPFGSRELKQLKEDIYYYDLIQYCVLVLAQDFRNIRGQWFTAVQLADILSTVCVGLDPKNDAEEFHGKVLPLAADNLMLLARRLQARFLKADEDDDKQDFLRYFHRVTDSLCWLLSGHVQLTPHVFQSDQLLQLLLTDDMETTVIMVSVLLNILQLNRTLLLSVKERSIQLILDEIIYELFENTNPVIGSTCIKIMLLIVESHPPTLQMLRNSYKGLSRLLNKLWTGRGFDEDLYQLLELLHVGSFQGVKEQKFYRAASLIQATWRAHQTRKRVKKLPKVVTNLQRSFRAKRAQDARRLEKEREEEELRHLLQLQRHRALRDFRQRQLSLLEIVPASEIAKYLKHEKEQSAMVIQKVWRGYRQRQSFSQQKSSLKKFKAAIIIQRYVLRFLEKRRNLRRDILTWRGPKGLTDTRRQELRAQLENYVKHHTVTHVTEERTKEQHAQVQEMLGQYLMRRNLERRSELRGEALLAQINTDVELLMSAPSLKEATEKDVELFNCRSAPVAARAKQCHGAMLQSVRGPWWKKLGDKMQDPDSIYADDVDLDLVL
ncbi:IQ calmodulin-binding motif-containing protein 1 [Amblyraja radiata]|uniref:IQ calmodulin-binding motif-containing protein 1 n=1 Tax=Amblyraja radiata TaxID=386614 RepID=UPI0014025042|nr:IQ calmodulin-binding motif-containing protein 1 [Amblyraja radiata]